MEFNKSIYELCPELNGKKFYLHSRFAKTASNFLHDCVFKRLKNDTFFYMPNAAINKVLLNSHDKKEFSDDDVANIVDTIVSELKGVTQEHVFIRGFDFFTDVWSEYSNHHNGYKLYSTLFPDATIFLVLRNQVDMLVSLLRHTIPTTACPPSVDKFLNFKDGKYMGKAPRPFHNVNVFGYDYFKFVEELNGYFPNARVEVLFYEDLKDNPDDFIKSVLDVLPCELEAPIEARKRENRGLSALSINLAMWLRKLSELPFLTKRDASGLPLKEAIKAAKPWDLPFMLFRRALLRLRVPANTFLFKVLDKYIYVDWDIIGKEKRESISDYYFEINKKLLPFLNGRIKKYYIRD